MAEHFSYQSILRATNADLLTALEEQAEAWLQSGKGSHDMIENAISLYCASEKKAAHDLPSDIHETLRMGLELFQSVKNATADRYNIELICALSGGGTYVSEGNEDTYRKWSDKSVVDTALTLSDNHPNATLFYNGTQEQNTAFPKHSNRIIISDAIVAHTANQLEDFQEKLKTQFQGVHHIALVAYEGQFLRLPFYLKKVLNDQSLSIYAHPAHGLNGTLHEALAVELARLIHYRCLGDLAETPYPIANA